MDSLDKEILNEIQWTFPLIPKPYSEMAKKFGLSDQELMKRNNQTN
jgi:siroheme decarboxylase